MSDHAPKAPPSADDAIKAALESVERIERERKMTEKIDDEFDPDDVELLTPDDLPPRIIVDGGDDDDDGEHAAAAAAPSSKATKKSPQDAMLAAMIAAKNEAVSVLEQTQKEAASLREQSLRVRADFENFKKRVNREKADSIRFANENLLKELLPVLDNMDRSLAVVKAATEAGPVDDAAARNLVDGVAMVARQFNDALGRFGVTPFTSLNGRFDPARHEAVSTREDASVPRDTVVEEYQRGYMLNDRLVRPAMVVVSTGGPAPESTRSTGPSADNVKDDGTTTNDETTTGEGNFGEDAN